MCNGAAKQVSTGVAPCNMIGFVKRFELPLQDKFHEVVLHGETLVFIITAIVLTVAEVKSGSTFRETCLATEVQKVSRKPTMLHVSLFRSAVARKFQLKVSTCNSGFERMSALTIKKNSVQKDFAVYYRI